MLCILETSIFGAFCCIFLHFAIPLGGSRSLPFSPVNPSLLGVYGEVNGWDWIATLRMTPALVALIP